MNKTKSYCLILLLTTLLVPFGCEDKKDLSKLSVPQTTARDQAISDAPGWIVYTEDGYEAAYISDVPGRIFHRSLWPLQSSPHPFIDLTTTHLMDDKVRELLPRSHSFDEYVSLLKKNGYKVVPNPDKRGKVFVSTASFKSSEKQIKTAPIDWRKKGNAANCTNYKPYNNRRIPKCNWYDAMAYCGGKLPTVAQLKKMFKDEGESKKYFGWHWSSEEVGADFARLVYSKDGYATKDYKSPKYIVRCAP